MKPASTLPRVLLPLLLCLVTVTVGGDAGGGDAGPSGARVAVSHALGDLNGDGRDDVLLRHTDGRWHYYPMNGPAFLAGQRGAAFLTSNPDWQFAGIGDLNGDGRDDVLLRRVTDGRWYYYPMNGRRNLTDQRGGANIVSDPDWQLAGIGDMNGDGRDDVLLRHTDGRWLYYPMNGREYIAGRRATANLTRDINWQVAGIGDLNGDGRDDVLLRHTDGRWLYYPMNGPAFLADQRGAAALTSNPDWQFAGIGDLNGDGRDDVLLRRVTDGRWYYYPMNGRRHLTGQRGGANIVSDPDWQLAGIGDMNGDGRDDVLLRHTDGRWLYYPMNGREYIAGRRAMANLTRDLDYAVAGGTGGGSSRTGGGNSGDNGDDGGSGDGVGGNEGNGGDGGDGGAAPDLVVEFLSISTDTLLPGESFTLRVTVRNRGAARSDATRLRYYRSTEASISSGDTEVGTDPVGALDASAMSSESIRLDAPQSPGVYFYGACANEVNDESDTGNNCSTGARVTVSDDNEDSAPDLAVYLPSRSTILLSPGESFTLSATVFNVGTVRSDATRLRYLEMRRVPYRGTDSIEVGANVVGELGPSAGSTKTTRLPPPTATSYPEHFRYMVCVDEVSGESNGYNNCTYTVDVVVCDDASYDNPSYEVCGRSNDTTTYDDDHGSTRHDATRLAPGESVSGYLSFSYDKVDVFRVPVHGPGILKVVETTGRERLVVELQNSSGVALRVEHSSDNGNMVIERAVSTGEYYISVRPRRINDGGSYTLHAEFISGDDDHGNTRQDATRLALGRSASGQIETSGDVDVFRIQVDEPGILTVYTTGYLETYGELQSSSGSRLAARFGAQDNGNFRIGREVSAGTYYISVDNFDDGHLVGGSYTLHAELTDDDHGNTRQDATRLALGGSASGQIETSGDVDVFRIQVDEPGILTAYTTGDDPDLRTTGELQNNSGSALAVELGEEDNGNFRIAREVSAGTYYLLVESSYNMAGSYTWQTEFSVHAPDLNVYLPSVSVNTLSPGESFTLHVTVRNIGGARSDATRLRYFRSTDPTISLDDLEEGTDSVGGLPAWTRSAQHSISLTAPSSAGNYFYGACADEVNDESNTGNNCSLGEFTVAVRGTTAGDDHGNTRSDATWLAMDDQTPGQIETGDDVDVFRVHLNYMGRIYLAGIRVYTTGTLDTAGEMLCDSSSGADDNSGSGNNFDMFILAGEGTCYIAVTSYGAETGSYTLHVSGFVPKPDLEVEIAGGGSSVSPGESFTLHATVHNTGRVASDATRLRYFRRSAKDAREGGIGSHPRDYAEDVGTVPVRALHASTSSSVSISLTAPLIVDEYFYWACADSVSSEEDSDNNCSDSSLYVAFHDVELGLAIPPEMVSIPGGSFLMGELLSREGGRRDYSNEIPAHRVTVEPFKLGKYEVTRAQWNACVLDGGCDGVLLSNPNWPFDFGDHIEGQEAAQSFIRWLNGKTGGGYRLPTEAEWEYAARAGSNTEYSWGNDIGRNRANCTERPHYNCGDRWEFTAPVGSFAPNRWGLHDMHGNVDELVRDCWHYDYEGAPTDGSAWTSGSNCRSRVIRGGSWDDRAGNLRSAVRYSYYRGLNDTLGFRLAQDE